MKKVIIISEYLRERYEIITKVKNESADKSICDLIEGVATGTESRKRLLDLYERDICNVD